MDLEMARKLVSEAPEVREYLSAEALELLDGKPERMNALEPICHDIARRIVKRESNDLSGAVRRFLAKGQTGQFEKWCDEFYRYDMPSFMDEVTLPVVESVELASGINKRQMLYEEFKDRLADKRQLIAGKSAETLLHEIDEWSEIRRESLARSIITILLETQ